jgi:hypothetical protein
VPPTPRCCRTCESRCGAAVCVRRGLDPGSDGAVVCVRAHGAATLQSLCLELFLSISFYIYTCYILYTSKFFNFFVYSTEYQCIHGRPAHASYHVQDFVGASQSLKAHQEALGHRDHLGDF